MFSADAKPAMPGQPSNKYKGSEPEFHTMYRPVLDRNISSFKMSTMPLP